MKKFVYMQIIFLLAFTNSIYSQVSVDFETGMVYTGYNNFRIPGSGGTKLSIADELKTDPSMFWRIRLEYNFSKKHNLSLLIAPLRLKADGTIDKDVVFLDHTFQTGTHLRSIYVFNSYRLTYRYDFHESEKTKIGIGFTAKIRHARITLEDTDVKMEKPDTGFVPILNFLYQYKLSQKMLFQIYGDALAAPQGRAEDVWLGFYYKLTDKFLLKAGYRILEGGADVDEVYTFSLFHYLSAGFKVEF
ncbi:hypothetical protein ACFL4T_13170 [candidate division KSB1 bacterium]